MPVGPRTITTNVNPHLMVASEFLRDYELHAIPEGLLDKLHSSLTHRTLVLNAFTNTLIPSHTIAAHLQQHHEETLDPAFLAHIIHTLLGWQHAGTVLDATTRTVEPAMDETAWLDGRIAQRLPAGSTYIAYKHRLARRNYIGFFVTPDTNIHGEPCLLTLHVGKYPITLQLELDRPQTQTIERALAPHQNWTRAPNRRDQRTTMSLIEIIKTLTGDPREHNEVNGLDIRTRAENISNLISHVLSSHQKLHQRLERQRAISPIPNMQPQILTPTSMLESIAQDPADPREMDTLHLIAAVHALNAGGSVIIHERPLTQLPNQLTTVHRISGALASSMNTLALYVCANVAPGATLNGVIIRPDIDATGRPQLTLTFHTVGFPTVIVPLDVFVWEAVTSVVNQLLIRDTRGLPQDPEKLNKYVTAVLSAANHFILREANTAYRKHSTQQVTYKHHECSPEQPVGELP